MTEYVVMFPADNEDERASRTDADRQVVFDVDFEFGQLLGARGGSITGGAALTRSSTGRTLTRGQDSRARVTTGAHRDSVEQLSGFFIVSCNDYDAVVEAAESLVAAHPVVEIRPVQRF